jgi:hypothetical protein
VAYRLSEVSLTTALRHLVRYGDTDIFPHLPELKFFADEEEKVIAELKTLDLDSYHPNGAIECLAPKSRLGFRIAHQLLALDNLLMLACAVEVGSLIEAKRLPAEGLESFSYRFSADEHGGIFDAGHTYKDWLVGQKEYLQNNHCQIVVSTDISDFYARVNFHRLDNLLDDVAGNHGAARFLKKQIKIIRAKQSFGLPVGGAAARILAELSLMDTDRALQDRGFFATRFVDDFRIFLGANEDAYDALGFLAEQLAINEGLSLNVAKTAVTTRDEYVSKLNEMTTEVMDEAQGVALEKLTSEIYFDESPDPDDVAKLRDVNLVGFLAEEVSKEAWDMGRIKVLFRALRIIRPEEAKDYIRENFKELVVFAKEACLLMEELERDDLCCFDELLDEIIDAILNPPAASVQAIRTWLLELFVRNVIEIPLSKLQRLSGLPSPMDKRQILLIRGRCKDTNYFRRQKTALDQLSLVEQPCLVWGASCLPGDEYDTWLANIKPTFARPLGELFLKWAKEHKGHLQERLSPNRDDHPL